MSQSPSRLTNVIVEPRRDPEVCRSKEERMIKAFEERERAAELLFARYEEARFAAHCYAVRALAAYAVRQLGVNDQTSEAYARVLIAAMIGGVDDEALLARVQADLAANGVDVSLTDLRDEMRRSTAQAAGTAGLVAARMTRRMAGRAAA
ncbi:DUF1476 domain-containing protein [Methylobacterium isbiliense]|nr:DUF1476 domain-containing protein [Methylobacterium isbiliense]MDN3626002.1 DUF1476 domain-containing protein [Methylobacterium isbiliense]